MTTPATTPPTAPEPASPWDTHEGILALYASTYPDDCVDAQVQLLASKSGNAAVEALVPTLPRPHTREQLLRVLALCRVEELHHVGW
jgi:hypothetical protein